VLAFESYGVSHAIECVSERQLELIKPILPPGWKACPPDAVDQSFRIESDAMLRWHLFRNDKRVTSASIDFDHLLLILEQQIRVYMAVHAPDFIFVHAGVVAIDGQLVVLPGLSFAGKTTLVAALVQAGAVYYSDEYAPIDETGIVHPYARPLSVRNADLTHNHTHVDALGGTAGVEPLPISRVVVTSYERGAQWNPHQLSAGQTVLALLSHTVPAQERPEQVMRHISRAVTPDVVAYEGARGEVEDLIPVLFESLAV